jgi:hypothetical protein
MVMPTSETDKADDPLGDVSCEDSSAVWNSVHLLGQPAPALRLVPAASRDLAGAGVWYQA